jgi:hypothetical protein
MRSDRWWKTEVELDVHINFDRIRKLCSRLHDISGKEGKNSFGRHGREKQLSTSSYPGNRRHEHWLGSGAFWEWMTSLPPALKA